jgi:glycosyltransferase involved in cell wall biosynthesis
MKLTIVTDHKFYLFNGEIYDNYVFDYHFFQTYLSVFEKVEIVARVNKVSTLHPNLKKTSGENLSFVKISPVSGIKWLLFSSFYISKKKNEIFSTDCFCLRIPSQTSWYVNQINKKHKKPFFFECIGDPQDSMMPSKTNPLTHFLYEKLGLILRDRMRKIVTNAAMGSYVSFNHLQNKYPLKEGRFSESISSIRLDKKYILEEPKKPSKDQNRIVQVGTFIPLKNHLDLISAIKSLKDMNIIYHVDFIGDGVLREKCEQKIKELDLTDQFKFYGQVTGFDNIVSILDSNDIFIIPSSNEGMPRSLIEAMSRQLMCFGSNVGGIAELLDQEFTFQAGDILAIVTLLEEYSKNKKQEKYAHAVQNNLAKAKTFTSEILQSKRISLLSKFKNYAIQRDI